MASSPPTTRRTWPVVVLATVLASAAALGVLLVAAAAGDDDPVADDRPSIELTPADQARGDLADALDLEFQDLDGDGTGTLADFAGRPLVLNFFASYCAPCQAEMPDFEAVHQRVGDEVQFVGLAVADRKSLALELVDRTGVTYFTAADGDAAIFTGVGGFNMPTTVFIDGDGNEVDRVTGAIDEDELAERITEHFGVAA